MKKRSRRELEIQKAVCAYLKLQYANLNLLIYSDLAGVNLSPKDRKEYKFRSKSSDRDFDAFPDLRIYHRVKNYVGLAIELKTEKTKIYTDKMTFTTDQIRKQSITLRRFSAQGWYALFGIGYDETVKIIDRYFKNEL